MFRASYTPPWSSTPAMLACELQSVFLTDFPLLWPRFREVSVYDYILLHSITARVPALTLRPVSLLSLTRCKATEALLLTMENRARAAESKLIAGEPPSPFVRLHDALSLVCETYHWPFVGSRFWSSIGNTHPLFL